MDFSFTPAQIAWRQEIRDFLATDFDEAITRFGDVVGSDEGWDLTLAFTRKLGARGWLGVGWPQEYGGMGRSIIDQMIYSEEMSYHRVPNITIGGTGIFGPGLMVYGSEPQKQRFLPKILTAEEIWCSGVSEPNAGSDLASMQTRAVRDGDDWVINGEKLWTSHAHRSDWIFFCARTDPEAPKHRGLTMFIAPMDTPGLSIRPLVNSAGSHHFNQTYFDDMRLPKEYLVGEENRGWYQMATTLDFERSSIAGTGHTRRSLEELVAFCKVHKRDGRPLIADPAVRGRLAQMAVELAVARNLSYRVAAMQQAGKIPNQEASMAKLFASEVGQRYAHMALEIIGLYGPINEPARWTQGGRRFAGGVLQPCATIAGGTSEIQRNIIATRGLGLPR
jgi:alkylation response protein AidB-like acyl-CoA dehydrogenase